MSSKINEVDIRNGISLLCEISHQNNIDAGWWTDKETGKSLLENPDVMRCLCLVHAEISEAVEAFRKDLMDDHLPHRLGIECELADAYIRIADLAGALKLDLGGAIIEKMEYNKTRLDHSIEARNKPNGKRF